MSMNREQIYAEVNRTLQELFEVEPDMIRPEALLYQDLDLDSIDAVDLVVRLQNVTNKKIQPEEFKSVRTVSDIVDAVEELLRA